MRATIDWLIIGVTIVVGAKVFRLMNDDLHRKWNAYREFRIDMIVRERGAIRNEQSNGA